MKSTFKVKPGTLVLHGGERYIVVKLQSLDKALCRRLSSDETMGLPCADLQPAESQELGAAVQSQRLDLATVPDDLWRVASSQMEVIRRLHEVGRYKRTREQVLEASKTLGKSPQTIYRWLKEFESDETIGVFLPKERADKGRSRLSDEVELVMENAMKGHLLKREASTFKTVHVEVVKECLLRGLPPPSLSLVRLRYLAIPEKVRVAKRHGSKVAKERFTPLRGSFPGADHPLDVIQIDHTPVDLIIVDEVYRKPIGRPTLTIAIDVCTRVLSR